MEREIEEIRELVRSNLSTKHGAVFDILADNERAEKEDLQRLVGEKAELLIQVERLQFKLDAAHFVNQQILNFVATLVSGNVPSKRFGANTLWSMPVED